MEQKKKEYKNSTPIMESAVTRSRDGKWVICKTTITTIRPAQYFERLLSQEELVEEA